MKKTLFIIIISLTPFFLKSQIAILPDNNKSEVLFTDIIMYLYPDSIDNNKKVIKNIYDLQNKNIGYGISIYCNNNSSYNESLFKIIKNMPEQIKQTDKELFIHANKNDTVNVSLHYLSNLTWCRFGGTGVYNISSKTNDSMQIECITVRNAIVNKFTLEEGILSLNEIELNIGANYNKIINEVIKCENIKYLKLYGNINKVSKQVIDLEHLQDLNYEYCNISKIPRFLRKIETLESISFHGNKIKKIPHYLYKCKKLQSIDFSENKIENIPESILKINELKVLRIGNIQIEENIEKKLLFSGVKIIKE